MRGTLVISFLLVFTSAVQLLAQNGTAAPVVRQKPAAKTPVGKGKAAAPKPETSRAETLVPLTERERAQQILDRFTFGPRPGDVDRVLAMGADKWLEQQLNPNAIKDPVLDRRLG